MDSSPHIIMTEQRLNLSTSQREVWLDQCAWPQSAHLNIGGILYCVGALDLDLSQKALSLLVAECDTLRMVPQDDGSQIMIDHFEPNLDIVDIKGHANHKDFIHQWGQNRMQELFALDGKTPPWRMAVLHVSDEPQGLHGLVIQFHHLVMDGWGTTLVIGRWGEIYSALYGGVEPAPNIHPSYVDFIQESDEYKKSEAFSRDAAFWNTQFPILPVPLIEQRYISVRSYQLPSSRLVVQPLLRSKYTRLEQHAAGLGYSPFNYFLAAIALYYIRITQGTEAVIGVPTLNRGGRRFKNTPGMFVGVLPLKIQAAPNMTAADMLSHCATVLRGALRHPRYPLSEIGRTLQVIRHGRGTLVDILLSFERQHYDAHFGAAHPIDARQLFSGIARYPLGVTVCEFHSDQDLELIVDASSACFAAGEAELLGHRLWHLTQTLMSQPKTMVQDIDILPPEERWELLHGIQQNTACHPKTQPYISLFEHQVALRPEATALVWDGGIMNYATLNGCACQLAHRLRPLGAGRDKLVALAIERSPEMVIALLAIAKAGAAFLPLDPDAPVERLTDIVQQSGAVSLLLQAPHQDRLASLHTQSLIIDWRELAGATEGLTDDLASTQPLPSDLAYVLFTSGSTGKPKGVMIEHATLSRRLAWLSHAYGVDWRDRSAQATQVTFDPSLIELFLPLIHGASVALPPPGRLLPESIMAFAQRHEVTLMAFVPSTLSRFLDAKNAPLKLRVACCGGEVLPPDLAQRFLTQTDARLYNVYGPTETAIFATAWECRPSFVESVLPIGSAIDDTRIYVLDDHLNPMPIGVVGEIFIGGTAIARGYLNRPDLDRGVFLEDPFQPGDRMYRTGDRGWLGVEGQLHFTGRIDRQIKLRGYRIELGEIEAVCMAVDGIQQAAAKLLERNGKTQIHVWVSVSQEVTADDLQRELRRRLPDYMIPGGISILPTIATSSVGKIDYDALPEPAISNKTDTADTLEHRTITPLEKNILASWENVLEARPIHTDDNFFDLGGDSLAAVSILSDLEKRLGRKVPMYLLTEHPTVERLALTLGKDIQQPGLITRLSDNSDKRCPPIYVAASGHGDLWRFQNLARALGPSGNVYMLQPPMDQAVGSITELAQLYAGAIAAQGSVPGFVAGFSVGGIAAIETARWLSHNGIAFRGLVLLDTIYPKAVLGGTTAWRILGWLVRNLHVQELSMNGRRLGAMFNDPGLVGQVMALRDYHPTAFDGPTWLIKSSGLMSWERWFFRPWRKLIAEHLTEHKVHGLHGSIFETDNVDELASMLTQLIRHGKNV